jgi:hypothetical protein
MQCSSDSKRKDIKRKSSKRKVRDRKWRNSYIMSSNRDSFSKSSGVTVRAVTRILTTSGGRRGVKK